MENRYNKVIGGLLIAGSIALLIPYSILTVTFEYPDILREETAVILTKFHEGGNALIWTWLSFATTGIPLIPAYILIGRQLDSSTSLVRIATNLGVTGLVVQMIGLLRWTFVVPVLAENFVNAADPATKSATIIAFRTIHQFAGVVLGEHLGQLFTVAWTVLITTSLSKTGITSKWVSGLGYFTSVIYFLAQAELFRTVIPGFPVWEMAGFLGSTLWLLWLVIVGIQFIKT